ncbi:mRNA (guanine-N7-)-methyltransferase [Aureococcus anophagefferens]|uniref:mRNA (guanine-N(7))-methyltransferase n=1 Tax=Aureococcus anophagefferens TaxID=44056 RepID=A0ABR1G9N5_AURAN
MGPSTARLEVDGHYVATLHWSDAGLVLPETLHITVVDGYERDACAWRRLGGRCALSASAGEAAALAAYAADLARPRDGRPYGKAAVLARDAAGAVAACRAAAAASFYNTLKRDRGTQHETRIYHMRRFNNWVKSELIRKAAARAAPGGPLSVLDLACGKGGDLSKWANAKPTNYVGVDIAKQSLDDAAGAAGAWATNAGVPCRLVEASLGNTSLVDGESAFATWDGSCDGGAWSSRRGAPARRLPRRVHAVRDPLHVRDAAARRGALPGFRARAPRGRPLRGDDHRRARARARALRGAARARAETPFAVGEGPWWRVDVDDEAPVDARKGLSAVAEAKAARRSGVLAATEDATYEKLRGAADAGDAFGLRYWFQLRDGDDALAVDSPEWLAPLPLRRGEDPAGFARSVDKMGVPDRAGSLSPAEWDVLSLVALEVRQEGRRAVSARAAVLAFPKVKRDWGDGWKTLDKARQLHLVALCARSETAAPAPPAPASLAVTSASPTRPSGT